MFDDTSKFAKIAEDSRPQRQFKENERKTNKPSGRKQLPQNAKEDAKQVNWTNPLIWPHIQSAVRKAGGPVWSPAAICRAAKHSAPEIFDRLTPQVVGTWIDREAKAKGINKWKDSVLERVEKGAAPGGESTRAGILVRPIP
jgi:hypothetical protein